MNMEFLRGQGRIKGGHFGQVPGAPRFRGAPQIFWVSECGKSHFRGSRFQKFSGGEPPDRPLIVAPWAPPRIATAIFSS